MERANWMEPVRSVGDVQKMRAEISSGVFVYTRMAHLLACDRANDSARICVENKVLFGTVAPQKRSASILGSNPSRERGINRRKARREFSRYKAGLTQTSTSACAREEMLGHDKEADAPTKCGLVAARQLGQACFSAWGAPSAGVKLKGHST